MSELIVKTEKLRLVKNASEDFMIRWAIDCMITDIFTGESLWGDMLAIPEITGQASFSKFTARLDD